MARFLSLTLASVMVVVLGPFAQAQVNEDYNVSLTDAEALPGEIAQVTIVLDFEDGDDINGWQWGVCHDDEVLILDEEEDVWDGAALEDLDFTFASVQIHTDAGASGWTGGYLLDVITYVVLEPGDGYEIAGIDYEVDADAEPGFTDIEWCDDLGSPTVAVQVIADGAEVDPAQWDGVVEVLEVVEFLRGDADDNGTVSALADALEILEYGFTGGSQPVCMDAADVDDNGVVSVLLDSLALMLWGFSDGDLPADPGPDTCGVDTTVDNLECDEATCP